MRFDVELGCANDRVTDNYSRAVEYCDGSLRYLGRGDMETVLWELVGRVYCAPLLEVCS